MTSFGCTEHKEGFYMPTFKIQGQIYHRIGSLLPTTNPGFLQVYFLSEADQMSLRQNIVPNLNPEIIQMIQSLLHTHNQYIKSFKAAIEQAPPNILDYKILIRADIIPVNYHRGCFNQPTTNEVAILLVDEYKGHRDIVLHSRNGKLQRVSELHRAYDPLQYPLIFVNGEDGYSINIPQVISGRANQNLSKKISCMQYYSYRFMVREGTVNFLLMFQQLLNQFVVDMAAKMITERLGYIKQNQKTLRAENYIHLRDAINNDANINPLNIGQQVILPSTFTGSPRYLHEKTQDAMTYVRHHGRPDLFITMTCNPEWPEIRHELYVGQNPHDRHDIISRVFHLKYQNLMNLITKNHIFGATVCHMSTIEWQKRGLPHAHILIWLQRKIQPDEIDLIISAEIPNKEEDPLLYEIVSKHMIHGPCGEYNSRSPCMVNGKCNKRFPRSFTVHTQSDNDGYPLYRRRSPEDGGHIAVLGRHSDTQVDNRWVVPHSPVLSRCFSAHINVEYCHSVKAIKYITKYVNKGNDRATFTVQNDCNEIEKYINGRYLSTSEAFWRIFELPIHERYPAVIHLAVHLENGQRVYFNQHNILQVLENPPQTTLTGFFKLCQDDDFAKTLLYCEVPAFYVWRNKNWQRRKRGQLVAGHLGVRKDAALGRVYTVHPNFTECYYLRLLLHHIRGPTSFAMLKTVNSIVQPSYQTACRNWAS